MRIAEVGILGGRHDGEVRAVPADETGAPFPELEAVECCVEVSPEGFLLITAEPVVFRLRPNPRNVGPLWHYVHPDVAD